MACESKNVPLACVRYGGVLPEWSALKNNHHVSMSDVVMELYYEVCRIRTAISTASLGHSCVSYSGKTLRVNDVLMKLKSLICVGDE